MRHTRTYYEMSTFSTYEDRFKYLKLNCSVGIDTFGFNRYMNQMFYKSKEWATIRSKVIIRDNGCDLGIPDRPICGTIYIHHIEPITVEDVQNSSPKLFDLNNLVCVSFETHNALHYGDTNEYLNRNKVIERKPGDTCPWK